MKVRVEYCPAVAGHDPESFYDAVEFDTGRVESPGEWADAVLAFVRPSLYTSKSILFEALCLAIESGSLGGFFARDKRAQALGLIEWLQDGIAHRDKLFPVESSQTDLSGQEVRDE
jgi:hypothetical protein